jgi:hypothetical protein
MKEMKSFAGKIKMVSSSPQGTTEGIVLENGTYIKIPPHSILDSDKIQAGANISGNGEMITEKPNQVFHHVITKIGNRVVSNDQGTPTENDALIKSHKLNSKAKGPAEYKNITVSGKVFSLAVKPNGEVDRVMLEDGTAVHLPTELLLDYKTLKLGDTLKVEGEGSNFKNLKFLKAKSISPVKVSSSQKL